MTTPPNHQQQPGQGPGPYQQGGPWPQQADPAYAVPGAPAYGAQGAQGPQGYGPQGYAAQGYGAPPGYPQPGQGYPPPGPAAQPGYGPPVPPQEGYGQPVHPQEGYGQPAHPQEAYGQPVHPVQPQQGYGHQGAAPAGPQAQPGPQVYPLAYQATAQPYQVGQPPAGDPQRPGSAVAAAGRSLVKRLVIGVVAVVVLAVAGYAVNLALGAPSTASVGDCMAGTNERELKVVDCGDPSAQWTVTGKIENKTEAEFTSDRNICAAFQEAGSAYWEGKRGKAGYVLCLKPRK